ncbi:hypothetical protein MAP00_001057 [Monascus purpureus]|nr:hypothetical protein MAP00_001057 [Monascus purpureus]
MRCRLSASKQVLLLFVSPSASGLPALTSNPIGLTTLWETILADFLLCYHYHSLVGRPIAAYYFGLIITWEVDTEEGGKEKENDLEGASGRNPAFFDSFGHHN